MSSVALTPTPMGPGIVIPNTFRLADRLKIQHEIMRNKQYIFLGKLISLVFEAPRSTRGLSGSRPRYVNSSAAAHTSDAMKPFSEKQTVLFNSISLDWLNHTKAPTICISKDQQNLLLPHGMTPLPAIPDPHWVPAHSRLACQKKDGCSGCMEPRIPQLLVGCPVVGDRVRDKITSGEGRTYGVICPVTQLVVMSGRGTGHFMTIYGRTNVADRTMLSFLIDDTEPNALRGYFPSGSFQLGG